MAFFVKVMPTTGPRGRVRVHAGGCPDCREGQGQVNQDKRSGPTYWEPAYPVPGFATLAEAEIFMAALDLGDPGLCKKCEKKGMFLDA